MIVHFIAVTTGLILPTITIEHNFVVEVVPKPPDAVIPGEPLDAKQKDKMIEEAVQKALKNAKKKAEEQDQAELKKQLEVIYGNQIKISELRHAALDAIDRSKTPHLKDFLRIYPKSFVRYLSFADAEFPSLSVTTTLHDRYTFNMRLPVKYSADNKTVIGYGSPKFHLLEVVDIVTKDGFLHQTGGGDLQERFDVKAWKRLVAAKGNFRVLGFELEPDSPVPNFEFVIKNLKALERQIPKQAAPSEP